MKKILVFSNFGYVTNTIGGQTVKVKHIYRLFEQKKKEEGFELSYFDTDRLSVKWKTPFWLLVCFKELLKASDIVFVGSKNNLKFFFPVIFLIAKIFNKKIDYIVVGGWLDNFLESHPLYVNLISSINGIYPETKSLCKILSDKYGLNNVYRLNNFRFIEHGQKSNGSQKKTLNLVFLARVSKEKGVGTLFLLAQKIEKLGLNASIDIYGPLDPGYQQEFYEHLSNKASLIEYKGLVASDEVYSILSSYNLMLFPTIYEGEGFPGSVLDAYISGIPVMASNWRYAHEFIEDGKTGILAEFGNDNDFIQKTLLLLKNPDKLIHLTHNAKKESMKYSPEAAWKILKNNMFKSK